MGVSSELVHRDVYIHNHMLVFLILNILQTSLFKIRLGYLLMPQCRCFLFLILFFFAYCRFYNLGMISLIYLQYLIHHLALPLCLILSIALPRRYTFLLRRLVVSPKTHLILSPHWAFVVLSHHGAFGVSAHDGVLS